jgi:hypothetical protein
MPIRFQAAEIRKVLKTGGKCFSKICDSTFWRAPVPKGSRRYRAHEKELRAAIFWGQLGVSG